jgi:azobenzene reductase
MKILVMCGSARKNANTRGLAQAISAMLKDKQAEVLYFDVGVDDLPIYKGGADLENETVIHLQQMAAQADGFFVCTPEYHSGMSGALKNALDFLGGAHFKGKAAAIACASGGGKGGINGLNNLRSVLRALYAVHIAEQITVDPPCFNEANDLTNEDTKEKLLIMVEQLIRLAGALKA